MHVSCMCELYIHALILNNVLCKLTEMKNSNKGGARLEGGKINPYIVGQAIWDITMHLPSIMHDCQNSIYITIQ